MSFKKEIILIMKLYHLHRYCRYTLVTNILIFEWFVDIKKSYKLQ